MAATDIFLSKIQFFCKIQPSGWTAFSLAVREYGCRPLHFVNPYPQPAIVPNTTLLPFDATITDRTNAELPTLRRRKLLDVLENSGSQPTRSWGRVVHQATSDSKAKQSELEVERPLTLFSLPIAGAANHLPTATGIPISNAWTSKEPTPLLQKALHSTDRGPSVLLGLKQGLIHHTEFARGRESAVVASFSHLADQTENAVQAVERFAAVADLLQDAADASLQAVRVSTGLETEKGKQHIELLRANFNLIQELSEQLLDD